MIAVPYIERTDEQRAQLFDKLAQIGRANALSRIVLPHRDFEPGRDLYPDAVKHLGRDGPLDSPFTFATLPDHHRGLVREAARTRPAEEMPLSR